MADLRAKLHSILSEAKENCSRELVRSMGEFGDDLRDICRGKQKIPFVEHTLGMAESLDAIEYIESHWQQEETRDFKVPMCNVEEMRAHFRDVFESGEAPKRGFVYVAWTQK